MRHFLDIDKTDRDALQAIIANARAMKDARGDAPKATPDAEAVMLKYGAFVQSVVDFLIIAFAIFMMVRWMNRLKKKEEAAPAAPPKPSSEEVLLTEIRDLLRNK